ncbi:hypothetical protein ACQF36_42040 [Streptomyces sp. Marseille-Q5077]|uniref:hypothetical protein n=1 Tax=Streptomyces sp. Marseille-Q5077 TaxID=3418995 RepID=UPI003CFF0939
MLLGLPCPGCKDFQKPYSWSFPKFTVWMPPCPEAKDRAFVAVRAVGSQPALPVRAKSVQSRIISPTLSLWLRAAR